MTLRPVWWRQNDLYVATVISGMVLFVAAHRPSQLPAAALITALLFGIFVYGMRRASICVNERGLTVTDVLGKPRTALGVHLRQVRIYSYWVVLTDESGREVLRTRPLWSRGQLNELAQALGAELMDGRRHHFARR